MPQGLPRGSLLLDFEWLQAAVYDRRCHGEENEKGWVAQPRVPENEMRMCGSRRDATATLDPIILPPFTCGFIETACYLSHAERHVGFSEK